MRFAPLAAFSVLALASLAGCGGGGSTPPEAAWVVSMIQSDPTQCMIADNTRSIGAVSNSKITTPEISGTTDGQLGTVTVQCTVSGTSSFSVDAQASAGPDSLHITIPSIDASASMSSPATGNISYESDATADNFYQGDCNFYFEQSMGVAVAAGRIWVAFQCPMLMSGLSTCPVDQGYAVFEDCLTEPMM
jgi:hypothetical protein